MGFAIKYIQNKMASFSESDSEVQKSLAQGNMICCCDTSASMTWVNKAPNRPYDIADLLLALFVLSWLETLQG